MFAICVVLMIVAGAQFMEHATWGELELLLIGGAIATCAALIALSPRSLWVATRGEAIPRIARWIGFRRYLEELPRLDDESPITLPTWEKLLVYATAFGCAERVAEAARLRVGDGARPRAPASAPARCTAAVGRLVMAIASTPGSPTPPRCTATSAVRSRRAPRHRPRPPRAAAAGRSAAAAVAGAEAAAAAPGRRPAPAPGPPRDRSIGSGRSGAQRAHVGAVRIEPPRLQRPG